MKFSKKIKTLLVSTFMVIGLLFNPVVSLAQSATYSCGTYGSSAYAQNNCGDAANKKGLLGNLADTGKNALPYILLGLLLLLGSATLFKLARKNAQKS